MALPIISDEATSRDVAEALRQVASETIELRNKRSKGEFSDSDKSDLREKVDFLNDMDTIQRALTAVEETQRNAEVSKSRGPSAAMDETGTRGYRTIGQQVAESQLYKDFSLAREASSTSRDINVQGSLHNQRTLLTTSSLDTSEAGVWLPVGQPLPPVPRQQRLFARDLMSQITTTLNAIPYILESSPVTTELGATAVVQGTAKPEVEMDFSLQLAVVAKIAAWIPATTEIIEDAPALQGYIDTRLAYMLALREEQQLLYGTGSNAQLHGVFNWSGSGQTGNQTQSQVAGDLPAGIGQAIAKIENVDLEADGAIFNAIDYWGAVTSRHSTHFDMGYGGNAPAVMSQITWGLPAIRARIVPSGTYGVGAFRLGATIADRQMLLIRIGNQHSTFFTENKVAILAEQREALLTHRPDGFVNGTV